MHASMHACMHAEQYRNSEVLSKLFTKYDRPQGDCSSDHDCSDGLICFQRTGFTEVPGCSGEGVESKDYCIYPNPEYLVYRGSGGFGPDNPLHLYVHSFLSVSPTSSQRSHLMIWLLKSIDAKATALQMMTVWATSSALSDPNSRPCLVAKVKVPTVPTTATWNRT